MNGIHPHILCKRKGNKSRAEKAEYQVPLERSTNEKQALKRKHRAEGEKTEGPDQRTEKNGRGITEKLM